MKGAEGHVNHRDTRLESKRERREASLGPQQSVVIGIVAGDPCFPDKLNAKSLEVGRTGCELPPPSPLLCRRARDK